MKRERFSPLRRCFANGIRSSRKLSILLSSLAIVVVPRVHGEAQQSPGSASSHLEPAQSGSQRGALPKKQVLRRALQADHSLQYFLYVPSTGGVGAPLFVAVHGISRNALEHATLLSEYAEKYGVVLFAPYFTEAEFSDYQRLGRAGNRRADFALDSLVTEVASLTGASAQKFYLFGFSGGAQFAHRYTMAHPDRVARAAIGAAGWYTFPDPRTPYPYGIGPSAEIPSLRFDPEKFLRVPVAVFVGENDVGNESLRRNDEVDRQQGVTRIERARNWVAAMKAAAEAHHLEPLVSYEKVAGIHHSFKQFMQEGQLGDRVFEALFGGPSPKKTGVGDRAAPDERSGSRQLPMDGSRQSDAATSLEQWALS